MKKGLTDISNSILPSHINTVPLLNKANWQIQYSISVYPHRNDLNDSKGRKCEKLK